MFQNPEFIIFAHSGVCHLKTDQTIEDTLRVTCNTYTNIQIILYSTTIAQERTNLVSWLTAAAAATFYPPACSRLKEASFKTSQDVRDFLFLEREGSSPSLFYALFGLVKQIFISSLLKFCCSFNLLFSCSRSTLELGVWKRGITRVLDLFMLSYVRCCIMCFSFISFFIFCLLLFILFSFPGMIKKKK